MTTSFGLLWRSTAALVLTLTLAMFGTGVAAAQSEQTAPTDGPANSGSTATLGAVPAPAAHADGVSSSAERADTRTGSGDTDTSAKAASVTDTSGQTGSPSSSYTVRASLKSADSSDGVVHTGDPEFDHASGTFPAFCKDWQRRLHDRELNNLENISWKEENGWKTGTYTAYSPIKSCSCKHSTGGVPIGELTYQETEEYLAGRTVEEARHAQPKPVGVTNTTEIFRWDKTKWDDGR